MGNGFFERLVARIDKLGPESLQLQMQRLAHERGFLETIFQTIQEGVIVIGNGGRLIYANRAAEKMAGFDFTKVKGRSVLRFLREWDWEHLLDMPEGENGWERMLAREIEVTYPRHRFLSLYAAPLADMEGVEKGVLVILRDITRDRQQEAGILESERFNAVKQLAAGVAHEIGNPLNALNIHLQLIARELRGLPGEAHAEIEQLVKVAHGEVERLDTIITQFLGAVRPSKPVLIPERPTAALRETLSLLASEFENRRISVSVDIPDAMPSVHLDRSQIKQVFFNLIKNALEAMPDGGKLKIEFIVGDIFVDISFRDTGAGMTRDAMRQVFEPYNTTKPGGTGLGLMIVQRVVEDHGGEIEISSKPGEGSCFTIRLPRSERRVRLLNRGGQDG